MQMVMSISIIFLALFHGPVTHIDLTHQETCRLSARPVPARSFLDDHGGGESSLNHPPKGLHLMNASMWLLHLFAPRQSHDKTRPSISTKMTHDSSFGGIFFIGESLEFKSFCFRVVFQFPQVVSGGVFFEGKFRSKHWVGCGKNAPRKWTHCNFY